MAAPQPVVGWCRLLLSLLAGCPIHLLAGHRGRADPCSGAHGRVAGGNRDRDLQGVSGIIEARGQASRRCRGAFKRYGRRPARREFCRATGEFSQHSWRGRAAHGLQALPRIPLHGSRNQLPQGQRLRAKSIKVIYATGEHPTRNVPTSKAERAAFVLSDEEILVLARWGTDIEVHYGCPMDMEWARDGETGQIFIVQARPETLQSPRDTGAFRSYRISSKGRTLTKGIAIGDAIVAGEVCLIENARHIDKFIDGSVLVTSTTDPDWVPIMKRAAAIVTDHGGRTSHAAIVSRELGLPELVGTGDATHVLHSGQDVTISCAEGDEGFVYEGKADFEAQTLDVSNLPDTRTQAMLNLASPGQPSVGGVYRSMASASPGWSSSSPTLSARTRWLCSGSIHSRTRRRSSRSQRQHRLRPGRGMDGAALFVEAFAARVAFLRHKWRRRSNSPRARHLSRKGHPDPFAATDSRGTSMSSRTSQIPIAEETIAPTIHSRLWSAIIRPRATPSSVASLRSDVPCE